MTEPLLKQPVAITLALQGGGAHGAFTWGVLDRLLDEPKLTIAALSGTSAGALNAAAVKVGLALGGPAAAQAELAALWGAVARAGDTRLAGWLSRAFPAAQMFAPLGALFPMAEQVWSPYGMGALMANPLEPMLARLDPAALAGGAGPRLFIAATHVATGDLRLFTGEQVGTAALLASSCLPMLFRAVEIDGQAYWDGGYSGNPALFPLLSPDLPQDMIIVSLNPWRRDGLPQTPADIQARVEEIGFHASLLAELRAIERLRAMIDRNWLTRARMAAPRLHLISDEALMAELSARSKLNAAPEQIARLHAAGRIAAQTFLQRHGRELGRNGTLDLGTVMQD